MLACSSGWLSEQICRGRGFAPTPIPGQRYLSHTPSSHNSNSSLAHSRVVGAHHPVCFSMKIAFCDLNTPFYPLRGQVITVLLLSPPIFPKKIELHLSADPLLVATGGAIRGALRERRGASRKAPRGAATRRGPLKPLWEHLKSATVSRRVQILPARSLCVGWA